MRVHQWLSTHAVSKKFSGKTGKKFTFESMQGYRFFFYVCLFLISGSILFMWATVSLAASPQAQAAGQAASFVATFNRVIIFPTIALLTAVAFLVFLWGVAEYVFNAANDQARQQGVKHITFGIIGLVVMVSAVAILSIATATFGLDKNLDCARNPSGPGCEALFTPPSGGGGPVVPGPGGGGGPVVPGPGGGGGGAIPSS